MPSRRFTIMASLALLGFIAVTLMVVFGVGIVHLDNAIAARVHNHGRSGHAADRVVQIMSPGLDSAVLAVVAIGLAFRRRSVWPIVAALGAGFILYVVVMGLKWAVGRGSPLGFGNYQGEFPSGHTASALVLLGTAVMLLWQGRNRALGMTVVAAISMVVGSALVWDKFHWFSDVLGSFLLAPALLWVISLTPAFRASVTGPNPVTISDDAPSHRSLSPVP